MTITEPNTVRDRLHDDGYAVVEHVLDRDTTPATSDSGSNVCSTRARADPFDAGPDAPKPPAHMGDWHSRIWDLDDDERRRLAQRRICFGRTAASSTPRGRFRTRTSASASSTSQLSSTAAAHSGSSTSSTRTSPSLPCWNIRS